MAGKREALIASAEKSLQKGKPEAALKDYLKVLEETPGDINVLNKVGDLFVRLNRNEESIPYFSRIAEHYSKDGFFLKAIAIYKKINKLDPARLDVYERLAELYAKQGLGMEAKSQYQVLADYYGKQDNIAGALAIYQKMLAADPQNIQLHVKLADLFTQARKTNEALKEYAAVAGMLKERGALEESIQVYEKALKIAPENLEILLTFVPMLADAGRYDEAKSFLKKALETTPRSVPVFLLAAETAMNHNDMAEARAFINKAQAVEPENDEVVAANVRINLKGRRPDLAFAAAGPVADQAVRRGEAKRALALLIPIAKASPDNEDLLRKVVEIASGAGDEPATVPFRSALAEIWRKQGKIVEAVESLRDCMRIAPEVADFRARLMSLEAMLPASAARQDLMPDSAGISLVGIDLKQVMRPETAPPTYVPPPKPAASAPAPPAPPPVPAPAPPKASPVAHAPNEFEFELPEEELVEEAEELPPPMPAASEPTPIPPTRRPPPQESRLSAIPQPSVGDFAAPAGPPALGSLNEGASWRGYEAPSQSAAEALARFEASQGSGYAPAPMIPPPPASDFEAGEELSALDALESSPSIPAPPSFVPTGIEAPSFEFEPSPAPLAPSDEPVAAGLAMGALEAIELPEEAVEIVEPEPEPEPEPAPPPPPPPPVVAPPPPPPKKAAPPPAVVAPPPPPPPAPAPAIGEDSRRRRVPTAPGRQAPAEAAIEEALVEAEVFRKYGLVDKAVDQLKALTKKQPEALKVREKLFELYLEQGKKTAARREAEVLKERYRADGREDRIKAIDVLLGDVPAPSKSERDISEELLAVPAKPKAAPSAPAVPPPPPAPPVEVAPPPAPPAPEPELVAEAEPAPTPAPAPQPAAEETFLEEMAGFEIPAAPPPQRISMAPPQPDIVEPLLATPMPGTYPPVPVAEAAPSEDDLAEIDFCLEQGMVVDAAERLQSLETRFPGHPEIRSRRQRLEGAKPTGEDRPGLQEILSEDLESVIDVELGRALTNEMAESAPPPSAPHVESPMPGPPVDESALFSDEAEFFNFADELQTEMKQEAVVSSAEAGGEVSLEEIFKEFKKGVEQQLSPEDYETHYNLGIAYKEMGLTDEAIGEFQLASKDPLHAVECCSMLGLCFLEKGLPQLALKWYRKGLETLGIKEDDRLGLLYDLGSVYLSVGDRDSAYKSFLEIYGSNASYRDVGDKVKELAPA